MTRLVFDALPTTLTVDGRAFPIDTDFRSWMDYEALLREKAPDQWKVDAAINMCFMGEQIKDQTTAVKQLFWFYSCGEDLDEVIKKAKTAQARRKKNEKRISSVPRIYDYQVDIRMIYAAFLAQYGLNLQSAALHWWEFRALFECLTDDHLIVKVMGYRSLNIAEIKNTKERRRYAKLQMQYRLPGELDEKKKIARAGSIFASGLSK